MWVCKYRCLLSPTNIYIFLLKLLLNIKFLSNISTSPFYHVPSLMLPFGTGATAKHACTHQFPDLIKLVFHRRRVHNSGSSTLTIIHDMHTYSPYRVHTCRDVHTVWCSRIITERACKNTGKNLQSQRILIQSLFLSYSTSMFFKAIGSICHGKWHWFMLYKRFCV